MKELLLRKGLVLVRQLRPGPIRETLERLLRGLPDGHSVGCRAARINRLARETPEAADYLEVGVQYGLTLASVTMKNKTGVDPNLMFNRLLVRDVTLHRKTSDEFFRRLSKDVLYDLIFLDGLHTFEQTARDFVNAVEHLKPGGIIVIDDVVPNSEAKTHPNREEAKRRQIVEAGSSDGEWFGDVWKLPVAISELYSGYLDVETVGFGPCGQAVVRQLNTHFPLPRIPEKAFSEFRELVFSDYFPASGKILLPSYRATDQDAGGYQA